MCKTMRASPGATERLVMVWTLLLALLLSGTAAARAEHKVLVLGDSLSAAYGLAREQGWVHLLDERLAAEHPGWSVVNASISGETTAGGAARIARELDTHRPAVVLIELGANDGLRGLPLEQTRGNLQQMVSASKAAGAQVLVIGMHIPPNYGPDYTEAFHGLFGEVAKAQGAAHLPFLLEPIATDREAFLPDNLHPTAEAQPKIFEHVWPAVEALIANAGK
jgi:acyl-CoA thioesterase I